MLSKFIYKALMVFALAFIAQVGYSQNYVSSDAALVLLEEAISDLESDLNTTPVNTGLVHTQIDQSEDKLKVQLMKAVKEEISTMKEVKDVMDAWYDKAALEGPERKTKMTLAIDSVKALLS